MQVLLMPMFLLSGAFFPLRGVPSWLEWLARIAPVTYGVDPIRPVALRKSVSASVLATFRAYPIATDLAIVAALGVVFLLPAVWRFGRQD